MVSSAVIVIRSRLRSALGYVCNIAKSYVMGSFYRSDQSHERAQMPNLHPDAVSSDMESLSTRTVDEQLGYDMLEPIPDASAVPE